MPNKDQILKVWKEQVCDKANDVDPYGERVWSDIFMGLVIGMGGTPDQSRELYTESLKLEGDAA